MISVFLIIYAVWLFWSQQGKERPSHVSVPVWCPWIWQFCMLLSVPKHWPISLREAFPSYPKTTPPKSFIWSQLKMMLLKLWIEHEQKQVEKAKNIWCHHALEHPGHTLVTERSCPMKKIPGLRSVGLQCMKFVKNSFSIHLKGVCWNWKECEQFVLRHLKKKKKKVWHKND